MIRHVEAETARAVRERIRSVVEWSVAMDLRGDIRAATATSRSSRREPQRVTGRILPPKPPRLLAPTRR